MKIFYTRYIKQLKWRLCSLTSLSRVMGSPVLNPDQGDGGNNVLDPSSGIGPTRI